MICNYNQYNYIPYFLYVPFHHLNHLLFVSFFLIEEFVKTPFLLFFVMTVEGLVCLILLFLTDVSVVITLIEESFMHVTNADGLTFKRHFTACDCWSISRLGEFRRRIERCLVTLED
mgnify:CR=1 FL=1